MCTRLHKKSFIVNRKAMLLLNDNVRQQIARVTWEKFHEILHHHP